ncbi:MAG: CpsD/CapB family tyrosine-protein kinase [Clostridia bacterium]|nr:CpsD/CapB family tyrosine-protein kinase [Clostridia bacterium]
MSLKQPKIKNINISSDTSDAVERKSNEKRIINSQTSFEIIEAYKAARTNIMFSLNSEKGCKKVVITSPTSGEGKTTTCINLACTFAETGAKVLIIDSDLRAPRLHKYLKLANEKGLSNILASFNTAEDCIIHTERENLDCITSGPVPPNPVELVSMDTMKELIEVLEKKYDYIFIDTPPLNIVTEALILSKYATGVIVVTRQKYTMYKAVDRAINSLKFANAKVIGFIMNDVDDNKYVYGGYKVNGGYRYGNKKSRYVRYGYYGVDNAQNHKAATAKTETDKKEKTEDKKETK